MIKSHSFLTSIVFIFCTTIVHSQNFSYSVETSTSSYSELDSTKIILPSEIWEYQLFKIPVGFSFNFAGSNYDSLTIKTNGLLSFGNENKFNFIFLNKDFLPYVDDANQTLSYISYDLIVNSENQKILKIEYKNMGMMTPQGNRIYCNFQVWLKQYSNKIEFHMGPVENNSEVTDSFQMGIINVENTSAADLGFLLEGNPSAPSGIHVTAGGNLVSLNSLPANSTVYTFTAQGN